MKKYFKRFSVAIIAVMLICSSFVFAGCGGNAPKFDDYFAIYNVDAKTNVNSAPYLAATDPDNPTDRVQIKVLKPVKIKHIRFTITTTAADAQKYNYQEGVKEIDSYYDGDYMHLAKTYAAGDTLNISSAYADRISNLLIEFEPVE